MHKFIISFDTGSLFVKTSFYLSKEFQKTKTFQTAKSNQTEKLNQTKESNQTEKFDLNIKKTKYKIQQNDEQTGFIYILEPQKLGKTDIGYQDATSIIKSTINSLEQIIKQKPDNIFITGRGKDIAKELGYVYVSEFKAISEFFKNFYPKISSVFEIGAENSKYLAINNGIIEDYETNGECAAGTGSFLDQQANRLKFKIENVSREALSAKKTAYIAGRCSVFAKSDMIHAQQKGYSPQEILSGLTASIAENYKANILKTKEYKTPTAFIGGVALNEAVIKNLQKSLSLDDKSFIVPEYPNFVASIGLSSIISHNKTEVFKPVKINKEFPRYPKLDTKDVIFLQNSIEQVDIDNFATQNTTSKIDTFLGIDIGSVSTNLVVVEKETGTVLKEIYLKTSGRPIDAVNEGLKEIENTIADKINILGLGTTGSGRELIGELIKADFIKDEITAHNKGASFISQKYFNKPVNTIFEIGGQDSKFISIQDGVVTDFHMNEACSAGTGSFLEEQAEKLGVQIKGEFSELALKADQPINLGDRCTVFIEKDLNSYYEQGAKLENLLAGLSYSVVNNYLNRVVKGRPIGETVYFQGGTAYNNSVAAAFSKILGKKIIVPPHNGVMGALGMALVSREKYKIRPYQTGFRGYDLNKVDYTIREFVCKSCANNCTMQEFTVEGHKTYWGDKCSDKFRKTAKTNLKPTGIDLIEKREQLLFDNYKKQHLDMDKFSGELVKIGLGLSDKKIKDLFYKKDRQIIGFPRSMYFWDRLPFWSAFIDDLGFNLLLSDPSNSTISKRGSNAIIADPCFPIKISHGHVLNLMDKKPDFILMPAMINAEPTLDDKSKAVGRPQYYFCPWAQTLPDMISNNSKFETYKNNFIKPKLELREGDDFVINDLYQEFKKFFPKLKKKQIQQAYEKGKQALKTFRESLYKTYLEEIQKIKAENREAIILVGRPYNTNDAGLNLNIGRKLRDNYGINVIPMDYIPVLDRTDEITGNMFWNYGRRILSTLKDISNKYNTHAIYITNFECGPDSYIKHFVTKALGGDSSLVIQFDEHANDAGILTRCEAYLDSKGVFDYELYKNQKNIQSTILNDENQQKNTNYNFNIQNNFNNEPIKRVARKREV